MIHERPARLWTVLLLLKLVLIFMGFKGSCGEEPGPANKLPERVFVDADHAARLHELGVSEAEFVQWAKARAYEKLAIADGLLQSMITKGHCRPGGDYEWKPGSDDLNTAAGRAKWAIERLLRIKLPGPVGLDITPSQLQKLHQTAANVVEAYRQGIMALAADYPVGQAELKRLVLKYNGKVKIGYPSEAEGSCLLFDDLLGEWSPVGRRYDELVLILGEKGEGREPWIRFLFRGGNMARDYVFEVRDGAIRSVATRGLED